jgi:hypothetical protein
MLVRYTVRCMATRESKQEVGKLVAIRVAPDILRRADKLLPKIAGDRTLATVGRITRSTVLKLALMRGLDALEQEHK